MADNAEEKELQINQHLDTLDQWWEDGPANGEAPEAYLKNLATEADSLAASIRQLTPEDLDEIFVDTDEDEEETE